MENLKEDLTRIHNSLEMALEDLEKFEGGNASAGTRIRRMMQDIKVCAQNIRVEVQTIKNSK